ncbi:MAG: hypothetical protein ACLR8Y_16965 [Alistipes indistinctus]
MKQMCAKLNELLAERQTGIVLDFEWIEKNSDGRFYPRKALGQSAAHEGL